MDMHLRSIWIFPDGIKSSRSSFSRIVGDSESQRASSRSIAFPRILAASILSTRRCTPSASRSETLPIYPVEVAQTWEHYYCVWDSQNGFCFEAAGTGFDKRTHDYYRHFRRIVTAEDESTFGFLRPLSRKELFACFAKERSHCLQEQFRFDEALEADYLAKTIAPHVAQFSMAYALTSSSRQLFRVLGATPSRSMLAEVDRLEKDFSSQLDGPAPSPCSSAAIMNLRRILRNRYQSAIQREHDDVLGAYTDFT